MPTYQYICSSCNFQWDAIHKISERDIPVNEDCPECKERCVSRQMLSAPSIGDPVRLGFTKPTGDVREVLQKISEKTAGGMGMRNNSNLAVL